jgi:hypothetical protein
MRLRRDIRRIGADDIGSQTLWRRRFSAGADGFLRWLTLCGWTYDPRAPSAERHRPFIPWPVQRRAGAELWHAIEEGHDVLIDKSRDMGASWLCLAALVWFWQFVPDTPILAASRKQQYVDERGNPDTLFWKLRYLIGRQPAWLVPPVEDRQLHLGNKANGSSLDGESTNSDLGRGGRRKAILLDEFAAVGPAEAASILTATADATPCRIYNSTPQGRAGSFADVRFSGKVRVITLHWTEHPDKGRQAHQVAAPDGKTHWTSPWYESECGRRTSRKEIAQEIDIDYLASGDSFFDLDVLQRIRASGQLAPALSVGDLTGEQFMSRTGGRLSLWTPLVDGRPLQVRNYAAFADIAHGTGASNSVLKVGCADTGDVVAEFASPDCPPHEFAGKAVALCRWLGGQRPCVLGWEANGPGQMFGMEVNRLGYGCVLGNQDYRIPWKPQDNKIGWWSTAGPMGTKVAVLGDLRGRLARGAIIIHDEATVSELERYILGPDGTPMIDTTADITTGARASHGDRVIALAGLCMALDQQSKAKSEAVPFPIVSLGARYAKWEREEARKSEW